MRNLPKLFLMLFSTSLLLNCEPKQEQSDQRSGATETLVVVEETAANEAINDVDANSEGTANAGEETVVGAGNTLVTIPPDTFIDDDVKLSISPVKRPVNAFSQAVLLTEPVKLEAKSAEGDLITRADTTKDMDVAMKVGDNITINNTYVLVVVDEGLPTEEKYFIPPEDLTKDKDGDGDTTLNFKARDPNAVYAVVETEDGEPPPGFESFIAPPPDPYGAQSIVLSDTSIKIAWLSALGTTADFVVSKAEGSTAASCDQGEATSETTITFSDLTPATQYVFKICSRNSRVPPDVSSGVITTGLTEAASINSGGDDDDDDSNATGPSAPANFTATPGGSSATLNWTSGSGDTAGYVLVQKSGSAVTFQPVDGIAYTTGQALVDGQTVLYAGVNNAYNDSGLTNGTTYHYAVFAFDATQAYSAKSVANTVPVAPAPTTPETFSVASADSQLSLSWTAGGGGTSTYLVVRSVSTAVSFNPTDGTPITMGDDLGNGHTAVYVGASTSHTDTGLTNGTTYHYALFSVNEDDVYSAPIQGNADPDIPLTDNITVSAAFPTNGANWMDYVVGSDYSDATDTACDPDGAVQCLHGGETLKVVLPSLNFCTNLSAADDLGAFDWVCDTTSGQTTFYSTGLKDGKHLSDLIKTDGSGFRSNFVTVSSLSNTVSSPINTWWQNSFAEYHGGVGLSDAGKIYVATANVVTPGQNVTSSKVGIVLMPGAKLTYTGTATLCYDTASSNNVAKCMLEVNGHDFGWFEGEFDGEGTAHTALGIANSNFVRVDNLRGTDTTSAALHFQNSDYFDVRKTYIHDSSTPIHLHSSGFGRMKNTTLKDFTGNGLDIFAGASSDNSFIDTYITNGSGSPISIMGGTDRLKFFNFRFSGKKNHSVTLDNGSTDFVFANGLIHNGNIGPAMTNLRHVIMNVTELDATSTDTSSMSVHSAAIINHTSYKTSTAVSNSASDGILYKNYAALIDGTSAINQQGGGGMAMTNMTYENIAVNNLVDNPNLYFEAATGTMYGELRTLTDGDTCTIIGGTINISDATCAPEDSNYQLRFNADLNEDAWVGDGTLTAYADITEWHETDLFKVWHEVDAGTGGDDDEHCETGEMCALIDLRLRTGDTGLGGTSAVIHNVLTCPGAEDFITHTWQDTSTVTYLKNSSEIMRDDIGNDNGLCESNETCLFTPNIGAYQGEGILVSANTPITDTPNCPDIGSGGTIENVTLMKYNSNGVTVE